MCSYYFVHRLFALLHLILFHINYIFLIISLCCVCFCNKTCCYARTASAVSSAVSQSAPFRVFPQTLRGPAGDWQDLFTGGEARRERRKEGEPEGERSLNGNPSFYTWPVFLSLFYVSLPHRFFSCPFLLGWRTRTVHFKRVFDFILILNSRRRHRNLVCFGSAS